MASVAVPSYQLKPSSYSSHSLLLSSLPEDGEGRRVLDIGCAGGYLSEMLAARGYRVTGIDAPGTGIAGFPDSVQLVEADLDLGLPALSGRFDFVICADVLEHLKHPEDMLEQIHGRLAAGGRVLASLPNSGNAYFRWHVMWGRFPAHPRGLFDRTHLHFYTWQGWQHLFNASGFRIEKLQCSGAPVGLALERWPAGGGVQTLEWLSYQAAQLWKTMFAYQFVVTAVET